MQILDVNIVKYFEVSAQSGSDNIKYRRPVFGGKKDWVRIWDEGRIHNAHNALEEYLQEQLKNINNGASYRNNSV